MKIVVLQPMYLPWYGYFEQIRLCDVFVHFDDVQLPQGRHFTNRVQVKTTQGSKWITVPVIKSPRQLIKEAKIDNAQNWRNSHLSCFLQNLGKAHYYSEVEYLLDRIYRLETDSLSSFNIHAAELIAAHMGLKCRFLKSSDLSIGGSSSEKLLNIVKKLNGTHYISGLGALGYLDFGLFEENGISVSLMDYSIMPYSQFYGDFTQYVSVIDLIAHNGSNSASLMESKLLDWKDYDHG